MPKNLIRAFWLAATLLLAGALTAGCASFDEQQRKWIFQPQTAGASQRTGNTDGMDDVWIEYTAPGDASKVKLHALWLANDNPRAPVLLYLHGARRNVSSSGFRIRQMQELGFSVLAIDYRGFGRSSEGLPSEATVAEDALAAWAWLDKHHGRQPRYIFGHSLGGAIAVQLASDVKDAKGLILEGTFTSIPDVFETMKWGWLPITPLITQRFDSARKIARLTLPVLVVHGEADTLIRPELGRALFERAGGPKRFELVQGGTHYSTNGVGQPQYREALRALFGLGA
ncbi:MAG: alpha/beta fold hydrolase [Burkholderiaceae bacterium]